MARYRLKHIVEAAQFFPDKKPWPPGINEGRCDCAALAQDERRCEIHKAGGTMYYVLDGPTPMDYRPRAVRISPGSWVVTYENGGRIALSPSDFVKMYEPL